MAIARYSNGIWVDPCHSRSIFTCWDCIDNTRADTTVWRELFDTDENMPEYGINALCSCPGITANLGCKFISTPVLQTRGWMLTKVKRWLKWVWGSSSSTYWWCVSFIQYIQTEENNSRLTRCVVGKTRASSCAVVYYSKLISIKRKQTRRERQTYSSNIRSANDNDILQWTRHFDATLLIERG